ncbi:fibrinolytic enzyme, isozyme C-like [Aplysia californica]|uniref:Fibrinolytic enzyme, isozyme C-like n=1 Tax=Aplysia californica TaxID=6500 RepID=A0ABM0JE10_APLCA|nr:fibrinolytic enzyme, isozyme C-like [Aplysia californica]
MACHIKHTWTETEHIYPFPTTSPAVYKRRTSFCGAIICQRAAVTTPVQQSNSQPPMCPCVSDVMKLVAAILLCLAASALCEKRIINGEAAELYSHPYITSLQKLERSFFFSYWRHICGGSLIHEKYVLTAAHCLTGLKLSELRVKLGALRLDSETSYESVRRVVKISIHENYKENDFGIPNDIAILELDTPATLNKNVQVAEMAAEGSSFLNTECVLAGWGMIGTGQAAQEATTLKEVNITKIDSQRCNDLWDGAGVTDKHICVHDASPPVGERPSACMGDSGGPMMCGPRHNILAGVTSWGERTCSGNYPSVYTRVSAYLGWIRSKAPGVFKN